MLGLVSFDYMKLELKNEYFPKHEQMNVSFKVASMIALTLICFDTVIKFYS